MKILCYGDSNTYGYDPRSYFGERYAADSRWPDILAERSGWEMIAAGQNGRELPRTEAEYAHLDWMLSMHQPAFLLIALGTNDILNCRSLGFGSSMDAERNVQNAVRQVTERMQKLLLHMKEKHPAIYPVILCPVPEDTGIESYDEGTRLLTPAFMALSGKYGAGCIETMNWGIDLAFDGSHYTEDGHRRYAEKLQEALQEMLR